MKKNSVIYNLLLNLVSSVVPLVVLHLLVFPYLSNGLGGEEYGFVITMYSMISIITSSGSALSSVRLLDNAENDPVNREKGDYNLILFIVSAIGCIATVISMICYKKDNTTTDFVLNIIMTFLILIRLYYMVEFLVNLDYKKIFINNITVTIGYVLGMYVFHITGYWQYTLIIGTAAGVFHLMYYGRMYKEGCCKTKHFRQINYNFIMLLIATLLTNVLTYIDKLWLYPALGGTVVSIYYSSTIVGKLLSLAINPISSVILSYLARMKKVKENQFKTICILSVSISVVFYLACILVSHPVLRILYADYADEAVKYIYITTLTAIISALSLLFSPFLLKFCDMKWQIIINISSIIVYVLFCSWLLNYGLYGFTIGVLITNAFKLLMMLIIYKFKNNKIQCT